MRLVRYMSGGKAQVGLRVEGGVVPTPWATFEELYALDDPLGAVQALGRHSGPALHPDRVLAPVIHRTTVIGTGGNYADHAEEAKDQLVVTEPVFMPFLWSAVIGPDDPIVIPSPHTQTDYEVEFAVVMGKESRGLTEENAMDSVFGYTVVNDVSAREVMVRETLQIMLSKSPDTFLPVGPHIVTRDEVPDPHALGITSYLNGEIRQKSNTGAMLVRIPKLLESLTATITLHPGDIVTTGTPGGVGFFRDPQEFMQDGDIITAEVEGVGRLMNRVVAGW